MIVSTVAAHIFFLHLLKFFRFIIFIVVIFCKCCCVNVHFELSCHSFYYYYLGFTACQDYFTHFEPSQTIARLVMSKGANKSYAKEILRVQLTMTNGIRKKVNKLVSVPIFLIF